MAPLNVGGMQNALTSVTDPAGPPVESAPEGRPFSVMVRASCEPNAPEVRCAQAGNTGFVQSASVLHDVSVCGSQVPVPIPVQQGNGVPAPVHFWHVPVPAPVQQGSGALAAVHVLFGSLCGHPFDGSPSKQPVLSWSRQNPQ